MKKIAIAAAAAVSLVGATAQPANAGVPGPCERQQALFEKYNIETDMDAPLVADAYNTACDRTG